MSGVTDKEGKQISPEVPPAGSIGKLESDPNHPEVKTGKIGIEIHVASDGTIFFNRENALAYEEFLREKNKSQGG